ncbi:beta-glucosidase [Syncephalastrum racemosum]|uniref:beta-glucosidase n=1 Tax=Syncephalastrum racemosum TaxID=13706 RepID=A0A1X2HGK5_SYNRA|nr:beta-glucosidase [Syncephalastrum racemosum]
MKLLSLTTVSAFLLATASAAPHPSGPIAWDSAYEKAEAIVSKMSLEQKVGLATGKGWEKTLCVGNTFEATDPDFPSLCLQDSPIGIRFGDNVTAGVSAITAAATFDKDLLYRRGAYMGVEARGKGVNTLLGPCVDPMRAPKAGRAWEAFGEDPYLNGVGAAETVAGIQDQGVIATAKHFYGNNQELNRKNSSSDISVRAVHEIWTWPYARAVDAGVGSIMCSYNQLNGTWACEDEYALTTLLKGEYGFKGFVQSDWGAQMSGAKSANAGLDMTMPGDIVMGDGLSWWGANLTKMVKDGEVKEERVTDMATRIAAAYYKMRQDEGYPEIAVNSFNRTEAPYVNVQGDHAKIVRELGAAGLVLLSNKDNTLPLSKKIKSIAIVGSDAGPNPDGLNPANCADHGCDNGTLAMGWGSGTVDYPYLVTPKDGIAKRAGKKVDIKYTFEDWDLEKAAETAKDADVAFVFSNADAGEEYISVDGNVGDRNNLTLWHNGDNLIKAVADANENTVVVIHAVGPVLMPWIDHPNIKAVVWPGLPGQESGNSLADVLFGDVNPSGRLPYTIAKDESDYNTDHDPNFNVVYSENLNVGYKHFDAENIEPLFAFGHGLSYSTFKYDDIKVSTSKKEDNMAKVSAKITNTGKVDGHEVAQVYVGFPEGAGEPPRLLRGFERVFLKKGKSTSVSFSLSKMDLSIFDEDKNDWVVPDGEYTVYVGASSRDLRLNATFTLSK